MALFCGLKDRLPPVIARSEVGNLLGGVIAPKTLANLDSAGSELERHRVGKKIVYRTEKLLEWLDARTKELK